MNSAAGLRGRWLAPLVIGACVLFFDQVTKWWALKVLSDRTVDLVWTLRLHLVYNTGAAFGRGEGWGPLLAFLVLVVVAMLVRLAAARNDAMSRAAIGAVVGGAVGNLADRLFRADDGLLTGAVVDFVDLQWWPVFNVADSAIVVGGVLAVWRGWRR